MTRDVILEEIDKCNKTCKNEDPFEAIIGFSQGAAMGVTLLADQMQRIRAGGVPCTFKMAVFLSDGPPMDINDSMLLLAYMDGHHVCGSTDGC